MESKIDQLVMFLDCTDEQAKAALDSTNNDVDAALNYIMD